MTPARMGRPPALTRAQIARVVIEVGFENLTMAAVRDRLGVGHNLQDVKRILQEVNSPSFYVCIEDRKSVV